MASPVVESLCCLPTRPDLSEHILQSFGTVEYNSVCLVASLFGMSGALWQLRVLRSWRQPSASPLFRRTRNLRTSGHCIVWWLAVADLCAAAGIAVRSCIWLLSDTAVSGTGGISSTSRIVCVTLAAWVHYFFTVTYLWTLLYCIDCVSSVRGSKPDMRFYHHLTWPTATILTAGGLLSLYAPDMACHNSGSNPYLRFLPNYLSTVLPLVVVLVVCPVLYCLAAYHLHSVVAGVSGRYTLSERSIVSGVRRRFLLMCLVFWMCWLPNVINAVVLWSAWDDLPYNFLSALWYIMAALNPMQALFNSFLYPSQSARSSFFSEGCSLAGFCFCIARLFTCGRCPPTPSKNDWITNTLDTDEVAEFDVNRELSTSEYQSASSSPLTRNSSSGADEHTYLLESYSVLKH